MLKCILILPISTVDRLNCDCAVESIDGEDSVQINFTGCGDSLILAAMNDSLPFYIESIQPNPAQDRLWLVSLLRQLRQ